MPNRGYTTLYEIDKELAAAFKVDCEEFLIEYEQKNSMSYVEFSKIWRQKKFTLVFAGQSYGLILKEFIENCFLTVKKFIVFPKSLETQVGALYLLYGLYYKQPLKNWVKVRLTFEEYENIYILLGEMRARGHLEPLYIFSKMKVDEAFVFVVQRKPWGPEDRFLKSYEMYYNDTFSVSKIKNIQDKFTNLISKSDLVKELTSTNKKYEMLLKSYSDKCNDLIPMGSTIISDLQEAHKNFVREDELTEAQVRAKSKVELKNKAMVHKSGNYRTRSATTLIDKNQPSGSGIEAKRPKDS